MKLLEKLKSTAAEIKEGGTDKFETVTLGRKRTKLLTDLGSLTHRAHVGETVDQALVDTVLADLATLDADLAKLAEKAEDAEEPTEAAQDDAVTESAPTKASKADGDAE